MNNDFASFEATWVPKINHKLDLLLSESNIDDRLALMMKYSVDAGGKRFRPLLVLAMVSASNIEITDSILTIACALEAIHTYSLIHDDLPAMDNDVLRRGKPTSHVKFGEAQAILSGDALLTIAFEWLAQLKDIPAQKILKVIAKFAVAAGPSGMVAGQRIDIDGNSHQYTLEELTYLHSLKTGALIKVPAEVAIILNDSQIMNNSERLIEFSEHLGLAFQIADDIKDVTKQTKELGKTAHKDEESGKNTFVNLLGLNEAQNQLDLHVNFCKKNIADLTSAGLKNSQILLGFLDYLK